MFIVHQPLMSRDAAAAATRVADGIIWLSLLLRGMFMDNVTPQ